MFFGMVPQLPQANTCIGTIASLPVGDTNGDILFRKNDCMKDAFPQFSQIIVSVSLISICCGGS